MAVLAILAALIGDYFIKLGERNHFYEATNAALAAAMTWIEVLRTQPWFWPSFLCLAGLAIGMRLDTFMRRYAARQPSAIPKGLEWLSGYDVFKLADPVLLEKHATARSDLEKANAPFPELFERRQKTTSMEEIQQIEAERDDLAKVVKERERSVDALWTAGWADIQKKLATGELLAKGFLRPVAQNPNELPIPAEYWRFLKFFDAFTTARGEDKSYTGVMVARAPSGMSCYQRK